MKKLSLILLIMDIFAIICLFILYGPFSYIRNTFIATAMETASHHYLARTFYSDRLINEVLKNNYIEEFTNNTNTSDITFDNTDTGNYESVYEEQILKRDKDTLYKIIEIDESSYKGYMAVIYDPSKLKLVMAKYLDEGGQKIDTIAKENDALVAINASGHYYPNGYEAYSIKPAGTVILDGKIYSVGDDPGFGGGLIGFTYDNVLMLTKEDAVDAINHGMKDAVSFGPFLIVNGTSANIKGNGGYGIAPRTAIGQRKDGIVLLLVIDGRSINSLGIDMSSMIDIFKRYKAYNAANLDGGGSSAMLADGVILNNPVNNGKETSRYISNAWILTN